MFVIWEIPNALGAFAGVGTIIGKHKFGWPQDNKLLSKVFGSSREHP